MRFYVLYDAEVEKQKEARNALFCQILILIKRGRLPNKGRRRQYRKR